MYTVKTEGGGKALSPGEIKRVKGLGCLQDKRFDDVFNVRVITRNGKITAREQMAVSALLNSRDILSFIKVSGRAVVLCGVLCGRFFRGDHEAAPDSGSDHCRRLFGGMDHGAEDRASLSGR